MKQIVKTIINEWDPIDIFPLFPEDEYEVEIDLIIEYIISFKDKKVLGSKIYELFKEQFGTGFLKSYDECFKIADKILIAIK